MNSPDDLMSTKHTQNSQHSGALGLWIVLATSVILLAFVISWMLQNEPWAEEPYVFSRSGHHAASPPVTELKLLSAEVVSRVSSADRNSSDPLEDLLISAQSGSESQSRHRRDARIASEPEPIIKPAQDNPSLSSVNDVDDGLTQESHFIQAALSQQSIDDFVLAGFEASTHSLAEKNDSDDEEQIYSVRSSSKKPDAINVSESLELTPEEIRSNALDSVALKSQEILFAEQSNDIPDNIDSVFTDIYNILSFYDNTEITVAVSTSEYDDTKQNIRLSQERGRAIIFRLVSQGIDFARFSLDVSSTGHSTEVSHMVKISAWPSAASIER